MVGHLAQPVARVDVQGRFARYAWFVLLFNLLVILVGTVVRATGSGDGCGSHWPVCNGAVVPLAPSIKTLIEFTHRLVSGLDGLLVLALVYGAFRLSAKGDPIRKAAVVTLLLTLVEAWIGRHLVKARLVADDASAARAIWMSVHLTNTFFLLTALTLTAWWASGRERLRLAGQGAVPGVLGLALGAMVFLGASGAVTALGDTLFPARSHEEVMALARQTEAHFLLKLRILHPYIAGCVGLYLLLVAGLVAHLRPSAEVRRWSHAVGWLFLVQVLAGFVNLLLKAPVPMQVVHLLLSDLVWVSVVLLGAAALADGVVHVEARSFAPASAEAIGPATWRDFLALTKPRVISLLLFTAVAAMFIAGGGWPGMSLMAVMLVGGYACAGAANVINMVIDRDIDGRMERTASRPTVTDKIPTSTALGFGLALAAGAFVTLWLGANLLSAMLGLAGLVFYVVVYTLLLKRRTAQNIVIGGAAGCFPPLVGWAAVTGDVRGMLAWYLFAIVFVWTPAHFWALALLLKDEYARVGIPMLPVVAGDRVTVIQIGIYALLTALVSLAPAVQGLVGAPYLMAAILLNGALVGMSVQLWRQTDRQRASRLFHFSMAYLALLFLAMAIDRSIGI